MTDGLWQNLQLHVLAGGSNFKQEASISF